MESFPYHIRPIDISKDAAEIAALIRTSFRPWLDHGNLEYLDKLEKALSKDLRCKKESILDQPHRLSIQYGGSCLHGCFRDGCRHGQHKSVLSARKKMLPADKCLCLTISQK